jgi:pantoate--beta-alanine ligase
MDIIDSVVGFRTWRKQAGSVALVPTMGNLHAGHLSLVERARELAEQTVVSIFVNPLQFGAGEDYSVYPRTLEKDADKLQQAGVDVLFAPSVEEVYPVPLSEATTIHVPELSEVLCGKSRPGHFAGMTTVVGKLFNMIQPTAAVFGQKDFQQLMIIRQMVADLNFPVAIVGMPIMRETDGLAMSSRNQYLNPTDRKHAPKLYQSLLSARERLLNGQDIAKIQSEWTQTMQNAGFSPEYLSIRSVRDFSETTNASEAVLLAAARLGTTRLIDNLVVK